MFGFYAAVAMVAKQIAYQISLRHYFLQKFSGVVMFSYR